MHPVAPLMPMHQALEPRPLVLAGQALVLRDATERDADQILRLHREVFGSTVDAEWFNWKYVRGHGEGVGLWHDGLLVAFCGGTPRRMWDAARGESRYLQIGDVMVAPSWRGFLARNSPFFQVSAGLYSSRLGLGREFLAGFGFPNARHLRLAVKSGLSWDAGAVDSLFWSTAGNSWRHAAWSWRFQALDSADPGFDNTVDRAWAAMRACPVGGAVGVRDAQYLRWRFVDRPDRRYRFLSLRPRWSSAPAGVAVFAQPHAPSADALLWLDWVGPVAWLPRACAAGLALARQDGAAGLTAWASPNVAVQLVSTAPLRIGQAAGVGIPKASALSEAQVVGQHGWWTAGDTDFL